MRALLFGGSILGPLILGNSHLGLVSVVLSGRLTALGSHGPLARLLSGMRFYFLDFWAPIILP